MFHLINAILSKLCVVRSAGMIVLSVGLAPLNAAMAQQESKRPFVFVSDENGMTNAASADALVARAQESGEIRIIIGVDAHFVPEVTLSATAAEGQRAAIAAAKAQLIGVLENPKSVRTFETIPYMFVTVSPTDLSRVLTASGVTSVQEDVRMEPDLYETMPLIETKDVGATGHKFDGAVVTVLNTGTHLNH